MESKHLFCVFTLIQFKIVFNDSFRIMTFKILKVIEGLGGHRVYNRGERGRLFAPECVLKLRGERSVGRSVVRIKIYSRFLRH